MHGVAIWCIGTYVLFREAESDSTLAREIGIERLAHSQVSSVGSLSMLDAFGLLLPSDKRLCSFAEGLCSHGQCNSQRLPTFHFWSKVTCLSLLDIGPLDLIVEIAWSPSLELRTTVRSRSSTAVSLSE